MTKVAKLSERRALPLPFAYSQKTSLVNPSTAFCIVHAHKLLIAIYIAQPHNTHPSFNCERRRDPSKISRCLVKFRKLFGRPEYNDSSPNQRTPTPRTVSQNVDLSTQCQKLPDMVADRFRGYSGLNYGRLYSCWQDIAGIYPQIHPFYQTILSQNRTAAMQLGKLTDLS